MGDDFSDLRKHFKKLIQRDLQLIKQLEEEVITYQNLLVDLK